MEVSYQIASILGPVLIALSISEYKNFEIWRGVQPTLVYLNGLVLFSGGTVVVSFHNVWTLAWTVMVTLIGWLLCILGLHRMMWPVSKQLEKTAAANAVFLFMFIVGVFFSVQAYLLR